MNKGGASVLDKFRSSSLKTGPTYSPLLPKSPTPLSMRHSATVESDLSIGEFRLLSSANLDNSDRDYLLKKRHL